MSKLRRRKWVSSQARKPKFTLLPPFCCVPALNGLVDAIHINESNLLHSLLIQILVYFGALTDKPRNDFPRYQGIL